VPEDDGAVGESAVRPFWSGTVTFGLVSVPVDVLPASRPAGVSLRMVSPQKHPLERRYYTARDDRELSWEEIVRGYELEKDRYVVVEDDELERLAPERTRDIDLRQFVQVSEIDPAYFERAYYLTPAGGSNKAYRLLAKVMEDTGRAGIATFVMRGKEYLVAIMAENGILRAETLRFAGDVRSPADVGLDNIPKPRPADVSRMTKEIEKLSEARLAPSELEDPYAKRLRALAARKLRSGTDVIAPAPREGDDEEIVDLVAILQESLRSGREGRRPKARNATAGRKRTKPVKKQANRARTRARRARSRT
jgi:DNA end-binding protein Ku